MPAKEKPQLPDDWDWADATREWFRAWRSSKCTNGWDERQWQYLFDTAIVHSLVYGSQDYGYLGELRQRLQYMGLEFDD